MKKRPTPYPLIGAAVFGVLAIVIFYAYIKQLNDGFETKLNNAVTEAESHGDARLKAYIATHPDQAYPSTLSTSDRPVLYASRDIESGMLIDPSMFVVKSTPKNLMLEAYSEQDADIVTKSYALRPIHEGDPLTENNIGKQAPRLADRIPIGMRAMSVSVFDNLTDGFLVDGDRVDIIYVHGDSKSGPVASEALLQNVPVLFVPGQPTRSSTTDSIVPVGAPGTQITLCFEVTLQQAQLLSVLSSVPNAHYEMILRSGPDNMIVKTRPVTTDQIAENSKYPQKTFAQSETDVKAMQGEQAKEDKAKKEEAKPTDIPSGL